MKSSPNSSKDDYSQEYEFTEIHTNPPFYDFKNAEIALGVNFEFISADGFDDFIREKYLDLLPLMRKCYQKKDFKMVDEHAHKLKGAFVYITSTFVSESANSLMINARNQNAHMIEDLYVDLLIKMNIFLEKLYEFSKITNNSIKHDFFQSYMKIMSELDSKETPQMKAKYSQHEKKIKEEVESGRFSSKPLLRKQTKEIKNLDSPNQKELDTHAYDNKNGEIILESNQKRDCCRFSDCLIF